MKDEAATVTKVLQILEMKLLAPEASVKTCVESIHINFRIDQMATVCLLLYVIRL